MSKVQKKKNKIKQDKNERTNEMPSLRTSEMTKADLRRHAPAILSLELR